MKSILIILFCLYLSSLLIRSSYELLKRAGRLDPKNKMLFAAIFTDMCIMWASWFAICPLDHIHLAIIAKIRWLGLGLFILGFGFAIGGLIQLRGLENINRLVTTGLFKKFRHPMYTGFILWIIGWAIFNNAMLSLMAGLIGICNILLWRHLEEEKLGAVYGDVYKKYRQGTWF
jgi:protein-S-isoprenylcysteine O-methyltransferase Ste14